MHLRANRCAWMLKELGIPFDSAPTNFQSGETREPAFLWINPDGRLPVLDDDGFRLFESLAINLYRARKFGGPLGPQSPEEDALATLWSFWALSEIEEPLPLAAANLKLFDAEGRRPAEGQIALGKLSRRWGVLEKRLANRRYVPGDRFTVADLNIAAVMTLAFTCGISIGALPRVKTWLHECLYRPSATDWRSVSFRILRPASDLGVMSMFV
jgi:glutathione S-transferase